MTNRLYFGDCLEVMREDIADESVDLIYLDPPFNSKRLYNAFIGGAQWVAFDDTWRWHEAVDDFHQVAGDVALAPTMEGLRNILGEGANLAYLSYIANRLRECRRVLKPTGSIYLHCDPTMSHYLKIVMDGIFGSGKIVSGFNSDGSRVPSTTKGESEGVRQDDVWNIGRVPPIKQIYPTQKPLGLLERIISASSRTGDTILDPFCGCGTSVHAAQGLRRRWIGIDICVNACKVIEERLRSHFDALWDDVEFIGMPKTRDDARTLASLDAFRFERWAASLVDGMEANKHQRGDKGIDGRGRLPIRKGQFIDIVSQVKGGGTGPGDVQAFNGARQQAGADLGIFTCFEDRVTPRMRDAAATVGLFMEVPVIQIYTIDDYFDGRVPKIPRAA